jgi:hypothetical protein
MGMSSRALDFDLCMREDFTDGIQELCDYLLNIMKLDLDKQQH